MSKVSGYVSKGITVIIAIIVLFLLYSELMPTAMESGDDLNASNTCERNGCSWNVTRAVDCTRDNQTSLDANACDTPSDMPLSSIFSASGFVFLLIMIGLLLVIVKLVMPSKKK